MNITVKPSKSSLEHEGPLVPIPHSAGYKILTGPTWHTAEPKAMLMVVAIFAT